MLKNAEAILTKLYAKIMAGTVAANAGLREDHAAGDAHGTDSAVRHDSTESPAELVADSGSRAGAGDAGADASDHDAGDGGGGDVLVFRGRPGYL
jgi:hypothetical protein